MANATQLPGSTIGQISLPYFGRFIKLAGDRQIADWTIEVVNDESFDLFAAFERWINAMGQTSTRANTQRFAGATSSPSSYVGQGIVKQYGKENKVLRTYKMSNVFPTSLSPIGLSFGATDQIESFSVNFSMDWFEVVPDGTTNGIGAN